MDILTLGFMLLIVGVSGFIAYVADNLGRKLGKKRLWLGKLRPKHVAIIGVVTTGMVVSFLTISLVSIFSSDVRQWILYGRRALVQLNQTRTKVSELEKQGSNLQAMNQQLNRNNLSLSNQASRLKLQITQQKSAIEKQSQTVKRLQSEISSYETRMKDLNERARKNQKELASSRGALRTAKAELAEIRVSIRKTQEEQVKAVKEFNDINRENLRVYALNANLTRDVGNLEKKIAGLQEESQRLQAQRTQIEQDLSTSRQDLERTRVELFSLESQLRTITADYNLAVSYNQLLGSTFATARRSRMTYKYGEEVVRMALPKDLSPDAAEDSVRVFLSMARTAATERGAKGNGPFAAADVVDHQDVVTRRTIPAPEIITNVTRQITNQKDEHVLVAYSSLNAFEGEPVSIEIGVFKNPVVYKQGTTLAEIRIDGTKDEPTIYRQVVNFLADKVTGRVAQDQVIPRSGSEQPFGEVSTEEVLNLVTQIRRADRRVLVRAQADEDTRASDRVRLRFQLF